jgi:hypothetical protein
MILDIKADSTFKYETCGNVMTGAWKKERNSLMLDIKSNYLKKDSSIRKNKIIVFEIKDDGELHRMFGEKYNIVDFLVKK